MNEELIPVVLFLSVALAVIAALYFRMRSRNELQVTVRQALDKGESLTPELLDRLGGAVRDRSVDLRRGVIGVALGVALALFGPILGEADAVRPLLAISMFPFVVGVAFLYLWYSRHD